LDPSRQGQVVNVAVSVDPSVARTKVLERKTVAAEGIRLEDADAVLTGGRGLGSPEGFSGLEELAKLLGGAVGATGPSATLVGGQCPTKSASPVRS